MKIGIDRYAKDLGERWRPIGDAAKDGSHYLVGWFELPGQRSMAVAFWHSTRKAWVGAIPYTDDPNWQPTHYMVLPAPPLPKPEEGEKG